MRICSGDIGCSATVAWEYQIQISEVPEDKRYSLYRQDSREHCGVPCDALSSTSTMSSSSNAPRYLPRYVCRD